MSVYLPHRVGVGEAPVAVHDEGYMLGDVPPQKQPNQPAQTAASCQHGCEDVQQLGLCIAGSAALQHRCDRWGISARSAAAQAGARAWEANSSDAAHK
jgi:hypothetical protein